MASFAVLCACVLIVVSGAVISRARRKRRRVGWTPVLLIVLAVATVLYATVPPLLS